MAWVKKYVLEPGLATVHLFAGEMQTKMRLAAMIVEDLLGGPNVSTLQAVVRSKNQVVWYWDYANADQCTTAAGALAFQVLAWPGVKTHDKLVDNKVHLAPMGASGGEAWLVEPVAIKDGGRQTGVDRLSGGPTVEVTLPRPMFVAYARAKKGAVLPLIAPVQVLNGPRDHPLLTGTQGHGPWWDWCRGNALRFEGDLSVWGKAASASCSLSDGVVRMIPSGVATLMGVPSPTITRMIQERSRLCDAVEALARAEDMTERVVALAAAVRYTSSLGVVTYSPSRTRWVTPYRLQTGDGMTAGAWVLSACNVRPYALHCIGPGSLSVTDSLTYSVNSSAPEPVEYVGEWLRSAEHGRSSPVAQASAGWHEAERMATWWQEPARTVAVPSGGGAIGFACEEMSVHITQMTQRRRAQDIVGIIEAWLRGGYSRVMALHEYWPVTGEVGRAVPNRGNMISSRPMFISSPNEVPTAEAVWKDVLAQLRLRGWGPRLLYDAGYAPDTGSGDDAPDDDEDEPLDDLELGCDTPIHERWGVGSYYAATHIRDDARTGAEANRGWRFRLVRHPEDMGGVLGMVIVANGVMGELRAVDGMSAEARAEAWRQVIADVEGTPGVTVI